MEGEESRVVAATDERVGDVPAAADDFDVSLVSLVLRGDKLLLRNAVSSCYNAATQRLVVVTAPALYLYGNLLELGGEVLGVVAADENVRFQHAMVLPWLGVYSVVAINAHGHIEHRIVSADFSECVPTHIIAERGSLFTTIANPLRREIISADSDGGFKVWAIRATTVSHTVKTSWKGFQRLHAGSRKTSYSYLCLAGDDQTILACTKTRIHAFDSTTCARIGTFYKDTSHTIVGFAFDRENDIIYLQINESRRLVFKLRGAYSRGRIHSLQTDGICAEGEDIAAFEPVVRGDLAASDVIRSSSNGILVLDTMGQLTIESCSTLDTSLKGSRRCIALPLAPTTEGYITMHLQTVRQETRNYVIVVASSGVVVVEVILPETSLPARRVVTNVAGSKAIMFDTHEQRRIAIFNSVPPSLLLFDDSKPDTFSAVLLRVPYTQDNHCADLTAPSEPSSSSVVDFAGLWNGVVVAWLSGDVTRYCFQTERTITVGRVHGTPVGVKATTLWQENREEWIFVGDDQGALSIWAIDMNGTTTLLCTKNLHNRSFRFISPIKGDSANHSICLLTVAIDGEVKLWSVHVQNDARLTWDLLVCFRTYASKVSASALMSPEFLFCGSEEGGFECWRLPVIPLSRLREDRFGRGHVAVIRRPLHSIDLHLTPVCQVIVEPGDAAHRVTSAQPQSDEFAWVITYDMDHIVLLWCFSASFLFPHRKLRPHAIPVGMFMTATNERSFRVYAYLGRCLDCIDETAEIDKLAVKRRLLKTRDPDGVLSHTVKHVQIDSPDARHLARHTTGEVDTSFVAPVRLQITLPSVTQFDALVDLDTTHRASPHKLSRSKLREHTSLPPDTSKPTNLISEDSKQEQSRVWSDGRALSPSPMPSEIVSRQISREEKTILRGSQSRHSTQRSESTFAPGTVQSQFQKAKPRVYRSERPITSTHQSRCAVVTSTINSSSQHVSHGKNNAVESGQRTVQTGNDSKRNAHQDRVTVVSITDEELVGHWRLDFQSALSAQRKSAKIDNESDRRIGEHRRVLTYFILWSSLGAEDQLVELLAATQSRFVVQEASEAKLPIPTHDDFSSGDVKAQLRVRAFSRWYLSTQNSHQRIREAFLREELCFAAQDAFMNMAIKSSGCSVPSKLQIDDATSPVWTSYTVWYATGYPFFGDGEPSTVDDAPHRISKRLQERTSFLKKRLESLEAARKHTSSSPSDGPYIFDVPELYDSGSGADVDVASWEDQCIECRQLELLLALIDPMIQVAAIADSIELPDVAVVKLVNVNAVSHAIAFTDWWRSQSNVYRQDFLNQEVLDAAADEGVREALQESGVLFREAYFRSALTREQFLTRKLQRTRRRIRLDEIFHTGKLAVPVLFEPLPPPAFVSFRFPTLRARAIATTDSNLSPEEVPENQYEIEEDHTVRGRITPRGAIELDDDWRRQEGELAIMLIEDELSRQFADGYESASEDEQELQRMPLEPPKRTDFTNSYFFSNLPKTFRINAGGWLAGSGIDNGDEEVEEEERIERERQHQEMLDRLEAERIAEAERQAERLRIEKEMDEKALQMRRLRQLELKKFLGYQAEIEARRFELIEHQNMLRELSAMEVEDFTMMEWLRFMESQRAAMEAEDRLAAGIALAERLARRDDMRRMLAELTQMDAEDRRSAAAQAKLLDLERQQQLRVRYLTELYEPFEPFFSESRAPSEEMLPAITRRTKQTPKLRKRGYALPFSEVVTIENTVEQELYASRDSRRMRQLMGLPVSTPHSKRMMRIPSESDIIKTRHDLQLMLPPTHDLVEDDRLDMEEGNGVNALVPSTRTVPISNQAGHREPRARLPELMHWKAKHLDRLTDLAMPPLATPAKSRNHPNAAKAKTADQSERQKTALPFFRGNFIVEGTRPRSQAYAQK